MTTQAAATAATETSGHLVIDLGKQKRKRVKALRSGEGPLMADVEGCLEELRNDGKIASDAQLVIVVVERRGRQLGFPISW